MSLTAKQFEALDFVLRGNVDGKISAQALMRLYEQRWAAKYKDGDDTDRMIARCGPGTNRRHGFRRSAGTVLERLRRDGMLHTVHIHYASYTYGLTDEGKAAYRQYKIESGQLRKGDFGMYLVVRPALTLSGQPSTQWWVSHSVFPENLRAERMSAKQIREMEIGDWDFFGGKDRAPWSMVVDGMISATPA